MPNKSNIVGCLEYVSFPAFGVGEVLAKVDTGAYSGALHCTGIKVVRRGRNEPPVLRFAPLGDDKLIQETADYKETYIKSSTGHRRKRYVISTQMICAGIEYNVQIGLSDRGDMRRGVLLGRRFLRENNILVDVRINSELDDEGKNTQ